MAQPDTIRVLFLCAAPPGTQRLDFRTEYLDTLRAVIALQKNRPPGAQRLELKAVYGTRPGDIQAELLAFRPSVVHFAAHGAPGTKNVRLDARAVRHAVSIGDDTSADMRAALLLEGSDGRARSVADNVLATVLGNYRDSVRCVVLNACYSRPIAERIVSYIDCAVGTTDAILDQSAIAFSRTFYGALASGDPVEAAVRKGTAEPLLAGLQPGSIDVVTRPGIDAGTLQLIAPFEPAASLGSFHAMETLRSLLSEINEQCYAVVHRAFQRAQRREWSASVAMPGILEMIELLLDRIADPGADEPPPLLTFAWLLAQPHGLAGHPAIADEIKSGLEGWIEVQLKAAAGETAWRRALAATGWSPVEQHLHIRLAPVARGSDRYDLRAWLDQNVIEEPAEGEWQDLAWCEPEAPRCLQAALSMLFGMVALQVEKDQLIVELFVERDSLDWPLDQIRYADPENEKMVTIGAQCQLAIRLHERCATPVFLQRLVDAWAGFKALWGQPARSVVEYAAGGALAGPVVWLAVAPADVDAFIKELRASAVSCLILEKDAAASAELRRRILLAGVPIVMWARGPFRVDEERKQMAALLGQPLARLRERVQVQRAKGGLGLYLTLVWDDPSDLKPLFDARLPGLGRR